MHQSLYFSKLRKACSGDDMRLLLDALSRKAVAHIPFPDVAVDASLVDELM